MTVCACMCVFEPNSLPFRGGRKSVAKTLQEIKHSEPSEMVLQ